MVESKHPDRIRVEQDSDGFWTCREAVPGSQEYVRADIASDLLEALKAAKAVVDVAEAMTSCGSDDEFVWSAQKLVNAAIAKAEGRS